MDFEQAEYVGRAVMPSISLNTHALSRTAFAVWLREISVSKGRYRDPAERDQGKAGMSAGSRNTLYVPLGRQMNAQAPIRNV